MLTFFAKRDSLPVLSEEGFKDAKARYPIFLHRDGLRLEIHKLILVANLKVRIGIPRT